MIWYYFLLAILSISHADVRVGSKKFTESVILGEMVHVWAQGQGIKSSHKKEIGGTRVLWNALLRDEIDIYPEYTGTLFREIFNIPNDDSELLKVELAKLGLGMSEPLGFNNTYALGLKRDQAESLNLHKISDLKGVSNLRYGFGEEFFNREDGWLGLRRRYDLEPKTKIRILDHDIAYRGLNVGELDVVDIYSTDGDIQYYDLMILEDDLKFFPKYEALYIYRLEIEPKISDFLSLTQKSITEEEMQSLNYDSKINKKPAHIVAGEWLFNKYGVTVDQNKFKSSKVRRLWIVTKEHMRLVFYSLFFAAAVGVPLAIISFKVPNIGKIITVFVSVVQTIPSLALLVILIPILHYLGLPSLGRVPAMIALFLYSLLPIVSNTLSGFRQIPISLFEMAEVLNIPFWTKLFRIELPLASPSIFVGFKIAAVLNVGFATLGALIGAGGYGQFILTGIRLDDYSLILQGAVPAAVLAILIQYGLEPAFKVLAKALKFLPF